MKTYWFHAESESYFECDTPEEEESALAADAVKVSEEQYLQGCVRTCGL